MGYLKASKTYNVSNRTLICISNIPWSKEEVIETKLERKTTLPPDLEALQITYCNENEKHFYNLRSCDIRRLSFQVAVRNDSNTLSFEKRKLLEKVLMIVIVYDKDS